MADFLFMVIAYPLQSQNDYTELLYSLRSIEKYFIPPYEVVIIGDKIPLWLTNVTQIVIPDIPGRKQLTIKKKTYTALEYADQIFFMNDDVYLMEETDGYSYPYYYQGLLTGNGESGARPLMTKLIEMKKPIKNFDIHQPLIYDKRFKEIFSRFHPDVVVKSCYCNFLEIEGEPHVDVKVNRSTNQADLERVLRGRKYFSTGPSGLGSAIPILNSLFPKKSYFEI